MLGGNVVVVLTIEVGGASSGIVVVVSGGIVVVVSGGNVEVVSGGNVVVVPGGNVVVAVAVAVLASGALTGGPTGGLTGGPTGGLTDGPTGGQSPSPFALAAAEVNRGASTAAAIRSATPQEPQLISASLRPFTVFSHLVVDTTDGTGRGRIPIVSRQESEADSGSGRFGLGVCR